MTVKKKPTLDELVDNTESAATTVPICMRAKLQATFETLERQLIEAQQTKRTMMTDGAQGQKIAEQMHSVREQMTDAVVEFRLESLSPPKFVALKAQHPPINDREAFNADTLGPALLKLSTVSPVLTDAQWDRLIGENGKLTLGQYTRLTDAAWALNVADIPVPFSQLASQLTRNYAAR